MKRDPSGYYKTLGIQIRKGEGGGHPFRGNQYSEGSSAEGGEGGRREDGNLFRLLRTENQVADRKAAISHLTASIGIPKAKLTIMIHGETKTHHNITAYTFGDPGARRSMESSLKDSGYKLTFRREKDGVTEFTHPKTSNSIRLKRVTDENDDYHGYTRVTAKIAKGKQ